MTNFFNRELYLRALGDIKFKKPVSLKKIVYSMVFIVIWSVPIILIFGFKLELWFVLIAFLPPLLLGNFASRPIFGGKNLLNFVKSLAIYIQEPAGWADLEAKSHPDEEYYYVEQEVWISRRRELKMLAGMRMEEDNV